MSNVGKVGWVDISVKDAPRLREFYEKGKRSTYQSKRYKLETLLESVRVKKFPSTGLLPKEKVLSMSR